MHTPLPALVLCLVALPAVAEDPLIQVGTAPPLLLDLRSADAAHLLPSDLRNPALVETSHRAWASLLAPLGQSQAVRLLLPSDGSRLPILLGACQVLKAMQPDRKVYLAFDPTAPPILEEQAWGAVDGGALIPDDLGRDASRWRDLLMKAQERFPGRPWYLWTPGDPGGRAAALLGDGGRLVVPDGGPTARLARMIPPEGVDVEGGQDLLAVRSRAGQVEQAWRFEGGEWLPTTRTEARVEVNVTAQEVYDVPALLARMRAMQMRDRAAVRNLEAEVSYNLHLQGERDSGDMGFTFQSFEQAGEPEELLRKEVRINGVRAKVGGDFQLPIIESRTSVALPVALTLTERYRYEDGGPAGPGRRRLRFHPVDGDPMLFAGELLVEEGSGRILEEHSHRDGLPGVVRSEHRSMVYGELAPGIWRVMQVDSHERWTLGSGTTQVRRTVVYSKPKVNAPDFKAARASARTSDASILRQTPDGFRYFAKQADGSRKVEDKVKTRGRAMAGVLLMDPSMSFPVLPLAGYLQWDYDAFGKGVQYEFLTALVFSNATLTIPQVAFGVDLHASATLMLLKGDDLPSKDGEELKKDAVSRRREVARLGIGRDLGAGFRLGLDGTFTLNSFGEAKDYRTPGFQAPPSGWTRLGTGSLTWQGGGFQAKAFYGKGQRPVGVFGTSSDLQRIANEGHMTRYGGTFAYDLDLGSGQWLNLGGGITAGRGFDRFESVDVSEFVQGIKRNALSTDRVHHADVRFVMPTGPSLRLTLGLEYAQARSLEDHKTYGFTGATVTGALPGFGWFSTVRVDLGIGLQSSIRGTKGLSGTIALLRLF